MAKVMGVSVEFIKAMEQKVDPSQLPQVGAALASWDLWILAGWCSCCRFFQRKHRKEVWLLTVQISKSSSNFEVNSSELTLTGLMNTVAGMPPEMVGFMTSPLAKKLKVPLKARSFAGDFLGSEGWNHWSEACMYIYIYIYTYLIYYLAIADQFWGWSWIESAGVSKSHCC